MNIHQFVFWLETISRKTGHWAAWLAVYMVVVQFAIVILRYVFSLSFLATVETVIYAHGLLFMLGVGYTLLYDGHVRVDVFCREASERTQAWIDLVGTMLFTLPLVMLTIWLSQSLIINSWAVFEGSEEAGGLPLLFLYKTVIWVFAGLLGIQAVAMALRSGLFLVGKTPEYQMQKDHSA